jgi:hypothetical protein
VIGTAQTRTAGFFSSFGDALSQSLVQDVPTLLNQVNQAVVSNLPQQPIYQGPNQLDSNQIPAPSANMSPQTALSPGGNKTVWIALAIGGAVVLLFGFATMGRR